MEYDSTTSIGKQKVIFHTLGLNILRQVMDLEANLPW